MNKEALLKQAAEKMLQLHQENKEHIKRAHALKLIYKQAELGCGDVPQDYRELQEKIATLLNQDLDVVEKALELTGGNLNLGELDSTTDLAPRNADESFQAAILGDL